MAAVADGWRGEADSALGGLLLRPRWPELQEKDHKHDADAHDFPPGGRGGRPQTPKACLSTTCFNGGHCILRPLALKSLRRLRTAATLVGQPPRRREVLA